TGCSVEFFFSSRRRHTRFSRDWSSDVCSSDLGDQRLERVRQTAVIENELEQHRHQIDDVLINHADHARLATFGTDPLQQAGKLRSEERRVGKEGRRRGGRKYLNKK